MAKCVRALNLEMGDHLLHLLLLFLVSMSTIAMGAELMLQRGDLKEARSNLSVVLLAGADKDQAETWWQLFSTPTQEAFLKFTLQLGEAEPVVIPPEGLEKTREIAVAEYSTVRSVEGIGTVDVVSWVLLFNCLNTDDEFAPVVAISASATSSSRFAYATLWKSYNPRSIVSNTPAAQLFNITLEQVQVSASNIIKDGKLSLKQGKVKPCGVPLIVAARPPLNTANSIPFLSCYAFQSSKILVLSGEFEKSFNGSLTSTSDDGCSAEDNVPLLLSYSSSDFLVCTNSTTNPFCANVTTTNTSACSMTTALSSSLEAVNNPGNTINSNCSITTGPKNRSEIWFLPKDSSPSATSKQFASEGEFCHLGLKTSPNDLVCLVNSSRVTACETAMEVDTEILDLLFTGIVTNYVDKHRTAFSVDQGQATDFATITATLLTALLAMVQSTVAFTNSELHLLNKLWKRFSNTPNNLFQAPLAIRLVLMLVNLSLAAALYSPVFAIIATEIDRSNTFQSWGMMADDLKVNTDGTVLRAIFIASGESKYKSKIPLVSALLLSLSLLIIGWKTLSRCNMIFGMRNLLKEHNPNMSEELITAKSIDSNAAEYLALKQLSQEQRNQASQDGSESDRRQRLSRSFLSVPSARSYQPLRIERS